MYLKTKYLQVHNKCITSVMCKLSKAATYKTFSHFPTLIWIIKNNYEEKFIIIQMKQKIPKKCSNSYIFLKIIG